MRERLLWATDSPLRIQRDDLEVQIGRRKGSLHFTLQSWHCSVNIDGQVEKLQNFKLRNSKFGIRRIALN